MTRLFYGGSPSLSLLRLARALALSLTDPAAAAVSPQDTVEPIEPDLSKPSSVLCFTAPSMCGCLNGALPCIYSKPEESLLRPTQDKTPHNFLLILGSIPGLIRRTNSPEQVHRHMVLDRIHLHVAKPPEGRRAEAHKDRPLVPAMRLQFIRTITPF